MKWGYYIYMYNSECADLCNLYEVYNAFIPSNLDWEKKDIKKFGIASYGYESDGISIGTSYHLFRMDENDIEGVVTQHHKIKGKERNSILKEVHARIEECLDYFYKHEYDDDAVFYYERDYILCHWEKQDIALEIYLGNRMPGDYLDKKKVIIKNMSDIHGFSIKLYDFLPHNKITAIESGVYKKMERIDFEFMPTKIYTINQDILTKSENFHLGDLFSFM